MGNWFQLLRRDAFVARREPRIFLTRSLVAAILVRGENREKARLADRATRRSRGRAIGDDVTTAKTVYLDTTRMNIITALSASLRYL